MKKFSDSKKFYKKIFSSTKKKIYFFFSTNRHRSPIRFGSPITMVLIHHWRRELRGRGSLKIRWDDSIHKSIFKTIVQASEKFWNLPFAHKTRRGFDIIERTGAFFSRIVHTSSWPTESEPSPRSYIYNANKQFYTINVISFFLTIIIFYYLILLQITILNSLAPFKCLLPGENPTEECSSSFDNIKTSTGFVCKRQVSKLFRGLNNRFESTFVYRFVSAYPQQNSPAKFAT